MDIVMPQEGLKEIFDQITRKVTEQAGGISLSQSDLPLAGDLYTVCVTFERGFHMGVSLCAEAPMFDRLTRYMMQQEEITHQDVEDFTKEYFNMLCGQIASQLFRVTKVASRFGIPTFHSGRYALEGHEEHFIINYTSDGDENAQIIHHTPR